MVSDVQSLNASLLIVRTFPYIVSFMRRVLPLNDDSPIVVTLVGTVYVSSIGIELRIVS